MTELRRCKLCGNLSEDLSYTWKKLRNLCKNCFTDLSTFEEERKSRNHGSVIQTAEQVVNQ